MSNLYVFKRYEMKFLLTDEVKRRITLEVGARMEADRHGKSTVRNLYFDSPGFALIRRSMEKPLYKEKLRLRCYSQVSHDDLVFVEIKKKYNSVVYKRRVETSEREAMLWLCGRAERPLDSQIALEIDYFLSHYGARKPAVYLSYDRDAYVDEGEQLRITFDENILARRDLLSLTETVGGRPLLPDGHAVMEIKSPGGIPLWLLEILRREKIYKTSFSKYAVAYRDMIFPEQYIINQYGQKEIDNA